MKLRFLSDTHLGLQRQSHTTPDSAKRMRQALYDAAMGVASPLPQEATIVIHAADLFDKYSNNELTIQQGFDVAKRCHYVVAGNHDCSNRTDAMSSLDVLSNEMDGSYGTVFVKGGFYGQGYPGFYLYFVPHQMAQDDFIAEFEAAARHAEACGDPGLKILVTHCNYDNPMTEKSESSLNLTREAAEELLNTFDYIFLGHEHNPRTDFFGRLVVLGSLMPTSFSDISDKCVWELDTSGINKLSSIPVWYKSIGHHAAEWIDIGPDMFEGFGRLQFLDITGTATPSQMPEVAKLIQDCWDKGPNLLMVRNSVVVEGEEGVAVSDNHKHVNVVDRVREELKGTEMGVRFEGYL
jgi:predicted phosphodiesterase